MATGRVLIVDDERFFRDLFSEVLSAKGMSVAAVPSAEEALQTLSGEKFDLLLADLHLPGMDGVQLVREARNRDPELETVAVTADDDVRTAVAAMKAGCADFLTKPVNREELASVVDRIVARQRLRREHSQLLDDNLQLARSQAIYRQCLTLLATLDLERLQDLTLAMLARVTDAQGAALWVTDEKGELVLRGYRGVVDRARLAPRIDLRAPGLGAETREGRPFTTAGMPPGEAFYLPLMADGEVAGLALLTDRARGLFGPEEQAVAGGIAEFAAIALKNARRFQTLERVGLRDRDTSAYNLSYFVDYAGKEFYKARRYNRQFALVVIAIDNLEQMRKEAGRDLFRTATRDLVTAVSRAMRDADILAKVADNEYYVLLPETDYFGALMFQRRAVAETRKEASLQRLEERCPVLLSMGAASFPKDGQDFDELLHHCRARTQEQRGSLVRRLHLDDLEPAAFWELCDILLGESCRLPESSPSARLPASATFFNALQQEVMREIGRDPRSRGVLYLGPGGSPGRSPALEALPRDGLARSGDASFHVFLLGPRTGGDERLDHPMVTQVFLDGDPRMASHEFLFFQGEHSAYGLVERPGESLFHTADAPLVDTLISKLQVLYDLQPL
jgi:two-component system, cell cycle response regulator